VNAAAVRIAVSSSTFRRPLGAAELTQLEWLERCASELGADGVLAAVEHFPRRDAEYVAQLRKIAIDLGLVPFGLDAPGLLDPSHGAPGEAHDETLALAVSFGAAVIRTTLPAPGNVPPATFVAATALAKALSRAAKAVNVTVLVAAAPGTLAEDLTGLKHAVKDVDSSWLRAAPSAVAVDAIGPRDRYPAFVAVPGDDPAAVAARASRSWVILDAAAEDIAAEAVPAAADPWALMRDAIGTLRAADAQLRLVAGR
jgi:hypothetical protein